MTGVQTCALPICRELTVSVNDLEREIRRLVRQLAPTLLELPGCGALSGAKIVGEVAGATRFRSKASFARWNGTAPIPVWSGNESRFRLNRGGNRQVNAALHRIAITQWRGEGPGHVYMAHRLASGDHKTEALRLLRRRLSDEVFRRLRADEQRRHDDARQTTLDRLDRREPPLPGLALAAG